MLLKYLDAFDITKSNVDTRWFGRSVKLPIELRLNSCGGCADHSFQLEASFVSDFERIVALRDERNRCESSVFTVSCKGSKVASLY